MFKLQTYYQVLLATATLAAGAGAIYVAYLLTGGA